jgi:hypothetical protein
MGMNRQMALIEVGKLLRPDVTRYQDGGGNVKKIKINCKKL